MSPGYISDLCRRKRLTAAIAETAFLRVLRILRNARFDLRYGRFLGGSVRSPYAHLGIADTANTDYAAMPKIFRNKIKNRDVLVDIGCGKGRVINWWLSRGLGNKIVGIEFDERIAGQTRKRLRGYKNVTIITGDALKLLPEGGTIFYMFNPFSGRWVTELRDVMLAQFRGRRNITLFYYNCVYVEVFRSDPNWIVKEIDLTSTVRLHRLAVITLRTQF
jgi:SAM-dependent methyltransferase